MSAFDVNGKEITVGCMVRHTKPEDPYFTFGLLPRRVERVQGASVIVENTMRGTVPAYCGGLLEIVS